MKNEFEIESGIPIPPGGKGGVRYPFEDLEIGQSFCVEGRSPQQFSNIRNYWASKLGRTFVARKTATGCRVWRTA